ncbi:MAG: FecR domain-containing protein [Candidatus Cloacimonetes bacterium]|nr:FecR domain-containing protein [Candidatus Cloacimonadota bacterium]
MRAYILAILSLIAIGLTGCNKQIDSSRALATIRAIHGDVFYHPADLDSRIKLQTSDVSRSLFHLDKLVVGKDSFLHLQFDDQGDLFIEPESTLIVQRPEPNTRFKVFAKLVSGIFSCFVEKQNSNFAVQTPVTVAGVLGTAFRVEVSTEATEIALVESRSGIELQSLEQDLKMPPLLTMGTTATGGISGSAISIREALTMESAPRIAEGIRKIENIHEYSYLAGYAASQPVRKALLDYNVRTTTIQR